MRTVRTLVVSGVALGLVGGCTAVGLPVRDGPPQTHVLAARPAGQAAIPSTGKTLHVAVPRVGAGLDSRRMAYMSRPFEVSYFASHEWADTPSRMLAPLLVRALEGAGAFRAVVDTPSPALAELRLDTDVLALRQEFLDDPSVGRVELRVQLVDLSRRVVVATDTFEAVEPAPSADAYGGVVALNRALERVLARVAAFAAAGARATSP